MDGWTFYAVQGSGLCICLLKPTSRTHECNVANNLDRKGVSFLSRIMGNKKREDTIDFRDNASEIGENRSGGNDAEVFSQPIGYIPKFPAPPRYIRVKAQNRRKRDFDRLFLAQILLDPQSSKSRRSSAQVDSKIHDINETPIAPPPNSSSKTRDNAIWTVEFSKDGKYLAAAGQDKKLRVWEVISTKDAKDEEDHSESGSESGQSVRLNAPVFKQKLIREYDGHTAAILDLSWSKNNFLLSSSMDKTVRLYHVSRLECLCAFKHNDFVTSIQFHPRDDRFFLAGSLDSKLRLWSIPDKSVAYWAQVSDMITAVAFTPDGKTAIAGTLSGVCILYSTEGLRAHSQIHVRSTRGRNTKGSKITGIDTISIPRDNGPPDVKLLITSNDSRIRMYNLKDRTLELKFRGNENTCSQIRAYFSDDGKFVICGSEDRKVYIWPTGPLEKPDTDRRPVEVFEAHSQIVTTALLAPMNTKKLLAQSGDPIYDICNPPPVVLLSRTDSVLSSPTNTNMSTHSDEKHIIMNGTSNTNSPGKQVETPSYLTRHAHKGGHIIVTADFSGQIKVFRQDCAFQKRRDATWDTGSTFSKRMLARSGSITPRTSIASSNTRGSFTLSSKSPSADHINKWRNAIDNMNSSSDANIGRSNSIRSVSPRRSLASRLNLRHGNTNLSNSDSAGTSPKKASPPPHMSAPDITVQSPQSPQGAALDFPPSDSLAKRRGTSPPRQINAKAEVSGPLSPVEESQSDSRHLSTLLPFNNKHGEENPLFLVGDQSYQAWDMRQTMLPMIDATPRTPGLRPPMNNRLSRAESIVSQLSSDLETPPNEEAYETASGEIKIQRPLHGRKASIATSGTEGDEEELRCKNCRSDKFRIVKVSGGGRGLKCKNCDTAV